MRDVTVCAELPARIPPGADHGHRYSDHRMKPGTAWRLDGEREVVKIKDAGKAKFTWCLMWIDGRTCAVFTGPDGKEYAQPVKDDPRARPRKARKATLRDAPGVAPQVAVPSTEAPAQKIRRKRSPPCYDVL